MRSYRRACARTGAQLHRSNIWKLHRSNAEVEVLTFSRGSRDSPKVRGTTGRVGLQQEHLGTAQVRGIGGGMSHFFLLEKKTCLEKKVFELFRKVQMFGALKRDIKVSFHQNSLFLMKKTQLRTAPKKAVGNDFPLRKSACPESAGVSHVIPAA